MLLQPAPAGALPLACHRAGKAFGSCYPPNRMLISVFPQTLVCLHAAVYVFQWAGSNQVSTPRLQFERQAADKPAAAGLPQPAEAGALAATTFWRVEGSLLDLGAVRPVAYFTWNAQSFLERWARRGSVALLVLVRPLLYSADRVFATRVLHALLRGVSRDRLDLLGEEYFHYVLKPQLKPKGMRKLKEWMTANGQVILVSQGLDHVMRPLANFLGVERLVANRLEFRDGLATGRLLEPVIRPRGALALLASHRPLVLFDHAKQLDRFSVRESLQGKHILLVGVTGFIGKVWLVNLLIDLPDIGKVYLLVRRQRSNSAQRRFEKIVEESPAFDPLHIRHSGDLGKFLGARVEVIEGDLSQPGLGIEPATRARLTGALDLVVNSSGLTDFNPDLRDALSANVAAVAHLLEFVRECDHAGLVHLSTCYVVGARDGRVTEELHPNSTPAHLPDFDAEREWHSLQELVKQVEARAESAEVTA